MDRDAELRMEASVSYSGGNSPSRWFTAVGPVFGSHVSGRKLVLRAGEPTMDARHAQIEISDFALVPDVLRNALLHDGNAKLRPDGLAARKTLLLELAQAMEDAAAKLRMDADRV